MTAKRRNNKLKRNIRKTFEGSKTKRKSYSKDKTRGKNKYSVAKAFVRKSHVARKKLNVEKVISEISHQEVAVDESAISTQPLSPSELIESKKNQEDQQHNLHNSEIKVKSSMLGQVSAEGIQTLQLQLQEFRKRFASDGDDVQLTQSLLLNDNKNECLTKAPKYNIEQQSFLEQDEHEQIYEYIRSTVAASCLLGNRSCQVLWGPHGNGQDKLLTRLVREVCETNSSIYGTTFVLHLDGNLLSGEEEAIRVIAEQMLVFLQSEKSAPLRVRNESIAHGTFDFGQLFHFDEQLCRIDDVNEKTEMNGRNENVRLQAEENNDASQEDDDDSNDSDDDSSSLEESSLMKQIEEETQVKTVVESGHLIVTNTESALSGSVANALPALQRALLLFKSEGVNLVVCINNIDRFAVWCDQILYLLSGLMHEVPSTSNSSEVLSSIRVNNLCKELEQEEEEEEEYQKKSNKGNIKANHKKNPSAVNKEERHDNKIMKTSKNGKSISNDCCKKVQACVSVSAMNANKPTIIGLNSSNSHNGAMLLLLTSSGPDIRHLEKRLSSRLTCETRFVPLLPWTPLTLCVCFVNGLQHKIRNKLYSFYNKQKPTIHAQSDKLVSCAEHDNCNASASSTTWHSSFCQKENCSEYTFDRNVNNYKSMNSHAGNMENARNTNADDKENKYSPKARGSRRTKRGSIISNKNNLSNKISKTIIKVSDGKDYTVVENALTSSTAKPNESTTQLQITSCKMFITRIMWEFMLVMCNSLEEELKNVNTTSNNTSDSVNSNTMCAHDKSSLDEAQTFRASNDNHLSMIKSLATELREQTRELTLSGAVAEMVLFSLFTSLRQSANGILDLFKWTSRISHVVWWRARLVEAYTLSPPLPSSKEAMRYFTLTRHIKESLIELSDSFGVSVECYATAKSPQIAQRWAEVIDSLSSSSSSPLALCPSLMSQEKLNVLNPSIGNTGSFAERHSGINSHNNKNNDDKRNDVVRKSEQTKIKGDSNNNNNSNAGSIRCTKLTTRPHCISLLSPPDMFDLFEHGQMLTNGYFSKEMFLLYVQLYVHEESYSSTVPVQRVQTKLKSRVMPLSSSSTSST